MTSIVKIAFQSPLGDSTLLCEINLPCSPDQVQEWTIKGVTLNQFGEQYASVGLIFCEDGRKCHQQATYNDSDDWDPEHGFD